MPDYGTRVTDKAIQAVEKDLRSIYNATKKDLQKKLRDFERRYAAQSKEKLFLLRKGKITMQEYSDWLSGQIFIQKQWKEKIAQVNKVLLTSNQQAISIINSKCFDVFAENYNFQAFRAEGIIHGMSFNLYNSESVARLIAENPQLLPEWKINELKDYIWNYKKINNAITQGIIQGESVEDIMKRLINGLCTQNENRMRMFARTAVNGAENAGRLQQMNEAAGMGIEVHKKWRATLDGVTRDAHRHLDGQEVPYDKPFQSDLGSIMFPCDASATPANVYNCRCTMVTIYPKYEDRSKPDRHSLETINGMTYQQWKRGKK